MRKIKLTFERPLFAHVRIYTWDEDLGDMAWLYIGTIREGRWEYAYGAPGTSDDERNEAMRRYLEQNSEAF